MDKDLARLSLPARCFRLQNDLKLLPLPFYDAAVNLHPVRAGRLPQRSPRPRRCRRRASSLRGSAFMTNDHPVRFPGKLRDSIPHRQRDRDQPKTQSEMPASVECRPEAPGPTISMRTNPVRSLLASCL